MSEEEEEAEEKPRTRARRGAAVPARYAKPKARPARASQRSVGRVATYDESDGASDDDASEMAEAMEEEEEEEHPRRRTQRTARKAIAAASEDDESDGSSEMLLDDDEGSAGGDGGGAAAAGEAWMVTGHRWLRVRVRRFFDERPSDGTLTAWLPPADGEGALWHMVHDDGDEEVRA
jgi:hypothetical protein